jgi:hypothetical protein
MLAPPPSRSSYGPTNDGDEANWFDTFSPTRTPITPLYSHADAVCVTLPHSAGGGLALRFSGVRWLANQGLSLDPAVERVLVMDATDLVHLPMGNEEKNAFGCDVEALWSGKGR